MNMVEGKGSNWQAEEIFPAIDNMRIPIQYLANLLTAGDESHIRLTLKKMAVMRTHMRAPQINKEPNEAVLKELGLTKQDVEDMYRLLAIAKYKDRFVIPGTHREQVADLYSEQGSCGLAFAGIQALV